jgi:hypothetical protein
MAVHRIAFSRSILRGIQEGTVTCTFRTGLVATPGDILLAGLDTHPALARLKVTGCRQAPFLELTRRELSRAGIRDPVTRAELLAGLNEGPNPTVIVIHFRLMKS